MTTPTATPAKDPLAVELGRRGGLKRAQNKNAEELSAIGRKGGKASGKARKKRKVSARH